MPLEHALAVEREHLKPSADLEPAAIQSERLKQHESNQHDAINDCLQTGRPADGIGQIVFAQRDQLWKGDEKDRPEKSAVHETESADHDQQKQVDRLNQAELIGRDEAHLVRIQCAGNTGHSGRYREGQAFVAREVDAHALSRNLGVSDRHKGTAGRRT